MAIVRFGRSTIRDFGHSAMVPLNTQVEEAAAAVREQWDRRPRVGIILGTGLGGFSQNINVDTAVDYHKIPHFPRSTAIGHKGRLVCGSIHGIPVVAMEGRFHRYEGYSPAEITLPVHVMKHLGIELLIVSNASGAVNPRYSVGDVMAIDDHINLMNTNPLRGLADASLGGFGLARSCPYDPQLVNRAVEIGRRADFVVHRGVYLAGRGPNYETRAEYRAFRRIGADVIGMSTIPEVLVAAHLGLRVLALSVIGNVALPDALTVSEGAAVVADAAAAEPKVRTIVLGIIADEAARAPQQV
jgi:purine-nucleoside phosphorylase